MRRRWPAAALTAAILATVPAVGQPPRAASAARVRVAETDAAFRQRLSQDQQIRHALDRLTFGPRPGDVEQVKRVGLKHWIDQQLSPERIAEYPVLAQRLQPLTTLPMSSRDLAYAFPPPQILIAMANGRIPYPEDPQQRAVLEALAKRYQEKLIRKGGNINEDDAEERQQALVGLAQLLTPQQFEMLRHGTPEEKITVLNSLPVSTLDKVLYALPQKGRKGLLAVAPTSLRRKLIYAAAPQQVIAHDLAEGKLYRAIYSNRQLSEVLVDFWYNHFNVYLDKAADKYLVTSYERDVIRPNVLGHFRELLLATAQSPAMLFYLDNAQSADPNAEQRMRPSLNANGRVPKRTARGLNENYARELMELHTLGVDGGYTQQDIREVARCFTGWTIRDPRRGAEFVFNERLHDRGEKTVLGVKIPAGGGIEDGEKVIAILAHHPATARFISRKLAQRFVADNPPESLIAAMARTFQKTDGDICELIRTMIHSPEFFSAGAYRVKVKSPLELVVSAVRAVDADVTAPIVLARRIGELGQPLYRKLEPTGYGNTGEEWVSAAGLLARVNFALDLTQNKLPGVKVDTQQFPAADPVEIARQILPVPVSPATRAAIEKGLEAHPKEAALTGALTAGLILGAPEFQRR